MSHSKERHEKICLNCNAELHGRYCHVCGQENIEPKETVWTLISHFFYDITHFDGKFFSTSKYLITRPGFLPKEYIEGRRARYLHPIRMYVFSSALFFLIFYSMFHFNMNPNKNDKEDANENNILIASMDSVRTKALANAKDSHDSAVIEGALGKVTPYRYKGRRDTAQRTASDQKADSMQKVDSAREATTTKKKKKNNWNFNVTGPDKNYTSIPQYDSVQKALPPDERDNWFERKVKYREIELNDRYKDDQKAMVKDLLEKFTHTFPYLLFVSLPLYAFYLRLLYWRRKQFLYVTHAIFLIYLYIFTFINLLVYFGLNKIHESMDWDWMGWLEAVVLLYGVYYAYKAMRKFYGQGRGKTLLKFFILNTVAFWSIAFLFAAFFLFTVFKF